MPTITFDRIMLNGGVVLTPTPFTLSYRKSDESTFTVIDTNVYVDINGYIVDSPLPSIELTDIGYYIIRATNDFCGDIYDQELVITSPTTYSWVEDDTYCEQDVPLNSIDTITGLADPRDAGYDSATGRMYIVDASAITSGSNIYWFDPNTITSASDVVPVGSIDVFAVASVMDMDNRKIYITGSDTGGMIRYDIATNIVSTLAYGTDGVYNRLLLSVIYANTLLSVDVVENVIYFIDMVTFTVADSVAFSSIPDYELYFKNSVGTYVLFINSEYWVIQSQGTSNPDYDSSIARYSSDFGTLIGTIALPLQVKWDNNSYWRSIFMDGDNLLIYDLGSNQFMKVDTTDMSVTLVHEFTNREGKTNSSMYVIKDEVSGELFLSGDYRNTSADGSAIPITYRIDNTTYEPITIYPDITYGTVAKRVGVSDMIIGTYVGSLLVYPDNPPGAATDGQINIFSKSGADDNTGTKYVVTLQEINDITEEPTGNIKINEAGDPDYIAPYEDLISCPVVYTELCPEVAYTIDGSDAEYEYSLVKSTANNPDIDHIVLEQIDSVTLVVLDTITVPKNTYQHGYITKIGANSNIIDLLFKDVADVTLSICSEIFIIP